MPNILIETFLKMKRTLLTTFIKRKAEAYGQNLHINGYSTVTKHTLLGENVNFNGMQILGEGKVMIGSNFHSGTGCMIITSVHNYDHGQTIPYDEVYINKSVIIEANVWFGNNVIVLGGVRIGEGSIIQAGSTVIKDIPSCAIAGGHPAQVFKYRDQQHYLKLKQEKKFF